MPLITGVNSYHSIYSAAQSTEALTNSARSLSADKNDSESEKAGLKKACTEFESLFVAHIMKEMRSTIPKDGLMNGGQAEEIYTSLLDEKLSKEISANGSLGLAKQLYEALSANSEAVKTPASKEPSGS